MMSVVVSARVRPEIRDQLDRLSVTKSRSEVVEELLLGALRNRHIFDPIPRAQNCRTCLMPAAAATHLTPSEVQAYRKAGLDLGLNDAPA